MRDYYFKVRGEKTYYCSISAESYERAKRNLLFACFSYKEGEEEPFKTKVPDVDSRWALLDAKYSRRISDSTAKEYEKMDVLQNE